MQRVLPSPRREGSGSLAVAATLRFFLGAASAVVPSLLSSLFSLSSAVLDALPVLVVLVALFAVLATAVMMAVAPIGADGAKMAVAGTR